MFKVPLLEKLISELFPAVFVVIFPLISTLPVLTVNRPSLLLLPPPLGVPLTNKFPTTFSIPDPTIISLVRELEPGLFIVISPETDNVIPELIWSLVSVDPPAIVIDEADLLSVTVTVAPTAIVTMSPAPGTTPPTQVEVRFQLPPVVVDVIAASVNSCHTFSPEDCPIALARNNSPTQSSSHTCHVVVKFPLPSANTSHVSWSAPIGSPIWWSACNTCSFAVSPGKKPVPVKIQVEPGW